MQRWAGIAALFALLFPALYLLGELGFLIGAEIVPGSRWAGSLATDQGAFRALAGLLALALWAIGLWLVWKPWRLARPTSLQTKALYGLATVASLGLIFLTVFKINFLVTEIV